MLVRWLHSEFCNLLKYYLFEAEKYFKFRFEQNNFFFWNKPQIVANIEIGCGVKFRQIFSKTTLEDRIRPYKFQVIKIFCSFL